MSGTHGSAVASPFGQPKAVFAVAFACVVSFMGIGHGEQVQAAHAAIAAQPDLAEEALAVGEGSET